MITTNEFEKNVARSSHGIVYDILACAWMGQGKLRKSSEELLKISAIKVKLSLCLTKYHAMKMYLLLN
jgi:hypothetical protein